MSSAIPTAYNLYLDRLLEDAHGAGVTPELAETLKIDLFGRLQNHLLSSLFQALPNEKADEFDAFMSGDPSQEEVEKFFQNTIPNHQEVVAAALLEFRDIYVNAVKA